jgi:crotonobetainyl-CoA:carnitine CoA-transferase CaiB-like acyl-CoA transferase
MFKGLKVIELANVLAGPLVGMFFSEQNARVIKIENKGTGGDMTRKWKLPSEDKNNPISAYYASANYNKEVLFLDLKNQADKEIIYNHIKDADIVISNFKVGSAKKLGMDYETLSKINSKLIYGHISGFGKNSNRPAFDLVLQAETGFMSMNGQPGSPPTKMPVALIDVLTAHQLKEGILTALWKREKLGKGALVETSLFDSAISSLANQATNWLMAGHIPQQNGSLHPNIAPYGEVFKTKDNIKLTLAIGTDLQFNSLCGILNIDISPKFETNSSRVIHRAELETILVEKISSISFNEIVNEFNIKEIPYGVIKNMKQVFDNNNIEHLILKEKQTDSTSKRPKTVAFSII